MDDEPKNPTARPAVKQEVTSVETGGAVIGAENVSADVDQKAKVVKGKVIGLRFGRPDHDSPTGEARSRSATGLGGRLGPFRADIWIGILALAAGGGFWILAAERSPVWTYVVGTVGSVALALVIVVYGRDRR